MSLTVQFGMTVNKICCHRPYPYLYRQTTIVSQWAGPKFSQKGDGVSNMFYLLLHFVLNHKLKKYNLDIFNVVNVN